MPLVPSGLGVYCVSCGSKMASSIKGESYQIEFICRKCGTVNIFVKSGPCPCPWANMQSKVDQQLDSQSKKEKEISKPS
jgi:hypothetical protein